MKLSKEKEQEIKNEYPISTFTGETQRELVDYVISKINTELERRDEEIVEIIEKLNYEIKTTSGMAEYYAKESVEKTKKAIIKLIK